MNILVVSPHCDDESLGAGGTLLRAKKAGHMINWLNFCQSLEAYGYDRALCEERDEQVNKVCEFLEVKKYISLDLEPAKLDCYDKSDLISKVKKVMDDIKPDIVILPHIGDAHSDHKVVNEVCTSCVKTFRNDYVKYVLTMEIISETEFGYGEKFSPNLYIDISNEMEEKLNLVSLYKKEIGDHPFPRSLKNMEALAIFRGATAGVEYAEAFHLLKGVI